jgi:hypothetical protein
MDSDSFGSAKPLIVAPRRFPSGPLPTQAVRPANFRPRPISQEAMEQPEYAPVGIKKKYAESF